jgi:DNA-binding Lrp family transcriptional regulator
VTLDELDRRLLDVIQSDFPIERRPYRLLAEQLGASEEDVLSRVRRLTEQGVIRRIGPVFNLRGLGGVSTLCAARIAGDKVDEAAAAINEFEEVTHNYLREHQYNVWFTLVAASRERIDGILREIESIDGVEGVISLPATRTFKINVHFSMNDGVGGSAQ